MDHQKNIAENRKKLFKEKYSVLKSQIEQVFEANPEQPEIEKFLEDILQIHQNIAQAPMLTMQIINDAIKRLQDIEKDLEPYLMPLRLKNIEQSLLTIKEGLDEIDDLINKGQISKELSTHLKKSRDDIKKELDFLNNLQEIKGDIPETNLLKPEFIERLEKKSLDIFKINTPFRKHLDEGTYAQEHRILMELQELWAKICQAVKNLMTLLKKKTPESEEGLAMSQSLPVPVVFRKEGDSLGKNIQKFLDTVQKKHESQKASAAQKPDIK